RRPQTANPLAEVQQKKLPPVRGEPADAVRVPQSAGAEKTCRLERANPLTQFECPTRSVQKNFSKIFKKLTIHGQFSPPSGIGLKEVTQ
ncbi:hypothetical protein, partial [Butyricicoccus sp. AM78-15b2TA]|uniref:hypothetical protein n=1 Tax=Butyricicoccus sp. AM78-15b2TA TaxID=3002516 RepID=UPI0022DFA477